MIDVSFVIIEYFSIDEIESFLRNIKKTIDGITYEVIISSNSCYDNSKQDEIKKMYNETNWIFNDKNGGFSFGMNQGLKIAKGRVFVIANPDTKIMHGFDDMLKFLDKNIEIGAIGPQIVDSRSVIQDSCRSYVSLPSFLNRHIKRITKKSEIIYEKEVDYTKIQTVDWVIGAFIMIRRDVYEKVGGLDERIFMYAEDVDWCYRIKKEGFQIVYFPKTVIEYKGSRSARSNNKFRIIFLKSHLILWRRHGLFKPNIEIEKVFYDV